MIPTLLGLLGTGLLAVFGWSFSIHSRVAVMEADRFSLKELIDIRLQDITRRLDRIEEKLS